MEIRPRQIHAYFFEDWYKSSISQTFSLLNITFKKLSVFILLVLLSFSSCIDEPYILSIQYDPTTSPINGCKGDQWDILWQISLYLA